jgi:hypothetical protein
MLHTIQDELIQLCQNILSERKTIEQWREIESSDMFQSKNYNGGFDSIEDEFCFSVYIDDKEYWFQFPLEDVQRIVNGELQELSLRIAG